MKTVLLLTLVMLSFGHLQNCFRKQCLSQMTHCTENEVCSANLRACKSKCASYTEALCLENCLMGSNSPVMKELVSCGEGCFLEHFTKKPCGTECLAPTKAAGEYCKDKPGPYADVDCIVDQLTIGGYTNCNDSQCVCSQTMQLGLFVAGCYC